MTDRARGSRDLPQEGRTPRLDAPDEDDHDLSLIVERLAWTPEQRLDANTAFIRFYLAARPNGPLISDDR